MSTDDESTGSKPDYVAPLAPASSFPVVVPSSGVPAFASVTPPSQRHTPDPFFPTGPAPTAPAPMPRSRARVWVVVLAVAALGLGALATYLWVINAQWQSQNELLRAKVAEISAQVDEATTRAAALETDLADAQTNLDGATGKVTDLADSSANALDQAAFLTELTDSFNQCVNAQSDHITHLQNASRYTASSLAAEGRDVQKYCDGVQKSYRDYLDTVESN